MTSICFGRYAYLKLSINNAAKGDEFFAGVGSNGLFFYPAKPLGNGTGELLGEFGKNRRLTVNLVRTNQRRAFYTRTFRAGKTVVVYVIGSRGKGVRFISEQIG